MTFEKTNIKRRGFLRSILRFSVAAGVSAGSVVLYNRNGGSVGETACCDPQGRMGCGACGVMAVCGLPRGLSYKQGRRDGGHG